MAEKAGAGGNPQKYDKTTGKYESNESASELSKKLIRKLSDKSSIVVDASKKLDLQTIDSINTIKLPDEIIPKSVGAKWKNYDISLPNGETAHLAEGSKLQNKEVFAGKGCKRKIDCVHRLVKTYGGKEENWQKVKAIGTIVYNNGEEETAELHWYEEPTIGKKELKKKVK